MHHTLLMKSQKFSVFLTIYLLCLKRESNMIIRKTLEEAMRKENLCYDQNKNKREDIPNWKNKRCENFEQKRKVISFIRTLGIIIGDTKGIILKIINKKIL